MPVQGQSGNMISVCGLVVLVAIMHCYGLQLYENT